MVLIEVLVIWGLSVFNNYYFLNDLILLLIQWFLFLDLDLLLRVTKIDLKHPLAILDNLLLLGLRCLNLFLQLLQLCITFSISLHVPKVLLFDLLLFFFQQFVLIVKAYEVGMLDFGRELLDAAGGRGTRGWGDERHALEAMLSGYQILAPSLIGT